MLDLDVAGEFIVMAATLIHIKSKMMLPADETEAAEENPRSELVRKLLEYQQFKEVAQELAKNEQKQQDVFWRLLPEGEGQPDETFVEVTLFDLLSAFKNVLAYLPSETVFEIAREEIDVIDKINEILDNLEAKPYMNFSELFSSATSRLAVIVTFLAMLELIRLKLIQARQIKPFDEIRISRTPGSVVPADMTFEQAAKLELEGQGSAKGGENGQ